HARQRDVRIGVQVAAQREVRGRVAALLPAAGQEMVEGVDARAADVGIARAVEGLVEFGGREAAPAMGLGGLLGERIALRTRRDERLVAPAGFLADLQPAAEVVGPAGRSRHLAPFAPAAGEVVAEWVPAGLGD